MARILLVEDEKSLCLMYQMELGAEGHEVIFVHDGKAALETVRREKPDLVILDLNLPEKMDGIESMSKILSEDKSVPFIINTGYSQYRDNFLTWAAEAYVIKSADLGPLKETIRRVLHGRPQGRETGPEAVEGTSSGQP